MEREEDQNVNRFNKGKPLSKITEIKNIAITLTIGGYVSRI